MKKQKTIRLKSITKVPALAQTSWGRHTIYPGAGLQLISDGALLIPAHILPVTKGYSCQGFICIKTDMEF